MSELDYHLIAKINRKQERDCAPTGLESNYQIIQNKNHVFGK